MKNTLGHIFNVVSCAVGSSAVAYAALSFQASLMDKFTSAAIGVAGAGLLLAGYNRFFSPKKLAAGLHWLADRIGAEPEQKPANKHFSLSKIWAVAATRASRMTNQVRYAFRTVADNRKYSQKLDAVAADLNLKELPGLLDKHADLEIASETLPNDLFIPEIGKYKPDGPVNVEGRSVRLVLVQTDPKKDNPVSREYYTFKQKGFQLMLLLNEPGKKPDVLVNFNYGKNPFGYRTSGGGISRYITDAIFPALKNDALKEIIAKAGHNSDDNVARALYAPWYESKHPRGFKPI